MTLSCAHCAQDGAEVVSVSFLCPGLQLLLSSVVLLSTWCGPTENLVLTSVAQCRLPTIPGLRLQSRKRAAPLCL